MLTHNDIAHLGIEALAALYESGQISHLVTDLRVIRSEDGNARSMVYQPLPFNGVDE